MLLREAGGAEDGHAGAGEVQASESTNEFTGDSQYPPQFEKPRLRSFEEPQFGDRLRGDGLRAMDVEV